MPIIFHITQVLLSYLCLLRQSLSFTLFPCLFVGLESLGILNSVFNCISVGTIYTQINLKLTVEISTFSSKRSSKWEQLYSYSIMRTHIAYLSIKLDHNLLNKEIFLSVLN